MQCCAELFLGLKMAYPNFCQYFRLNEVILRSFQWTNSFSKPETGTSYGNSELELELEFVSKLDLELVLKN